MRAIATKAGYFVFHFAEMWFAMLLGMAVFMVVRIALAAQGYAALLDPTGLAFQVGMGAFMVGPMLAWMRMRGCGWRECGGMCAAMLLSTAAAVMPRALDTHDALLPWLASNQHALMLVGMLAFMLYRHERYTSGYSFARWSGGSRRQGVNV
jgi:hypothetical protein